MFLLEPLLATIATVIMVLIIGTMVVSMFFINIRYHKIREVITDINGNVIDRIATVRLIKATGTENFETERFKSVHKEYYDHSKKDCIMNASFGLTMATVSAVRIEDMITAPSIMEHHYFDGIELEEISGEIKLKGVQFEYPEKPGKVILPKFDFTFEAGKSYAFVGQTGSGKTTIIKLEDLMKGRTTVSIAHRLSTIKNADHIIVLGANGAGIVQTGTFDELKNKAGHFQNLYKAGLMA
ncbi:hypothetical protein FQA39_LY12861 [Lamprigera yunnana]|nr:hypothetical protein FQA39_LY12861 [Lamprigera yunnana]